MRGGEDKAPVLKAQGEGDADRLAFVSRFSHAQSSSTLTSAMTRLASADTASSVKPRRRAGAAQTGKRKVPFGRRESPGVSWLSVRAFETALQTPPGLAATQSQPVTSLRPRHNTPPASARFFRRTPRVTFLNDREVKKNQLSLCLRAQIPG